MKIAIVGSHPETWKNAPFDDETWTIWGFSRKIHGKLPRCDVWFELHPQRLFHTYKPEYVEWLKSFPHRMTHPMFPWDKIREQFGDYFFTAGQAPWIMAYAITQEPDTIGLYGIEAAHAPYKQQRHELNHFYLVAKDRGIAVTGDNGLFDPEKLYAFS